MPNVKCPHCGTGTAPDAPEAPYCCRGCKSVAELLKAEGLDRYYDLAQGAVLPATATTPRGEAWLEPLLSRADARPGDVCTLDLDAQGMHCAACVWLFEQVWARQPGGVRIRVNPALGRVSLAWRRGEGTAPAFVREIEKFGYRLGESRRTARAASGVGLLRLGVTAALAMNTMIFAVGFYAGLGPDDPATFRLFGGVSAVLSGLAVLVGGWPFFASAILALRRRILHLDLPIAVGMLLAYATSLAHWARGHADHAYFDTVATFALLMLVGRWLQQRLLDRNQHHLLATGGAGDLPVRRVVGTALEFVRAAQVGEGDVLVICAGDPVPVDALLLDETASISLDWVNGESTPRSIRVGDPVPAGAFASGGRSMRVRAAVPFAASTLLPLLRADDEATAQASAVRFAATLSKVYVPVVLTLSIGGFVAWSFIDPSRALDVAVALLVVTCPCALGLALPLAHELAHAALRRRGVLVRSADLFDRLRHVRQVLFDKTGTLTLGDLELVDPASLAALEAPARDALYDLASRSNHPASRALVEPLRRAGARLDPAAVVVEVPGEGVRLDRDGTWTLGRAADGLPANGPVFAHDARTICTLALRETMRADAVGEVSRLRAQGLAVHLISGDGSDRVQASGEALGLDVANVHSRCSPAEKARLVEGLGAASCLFVGDGVNDALAFGKAGVTAAPSTEHPAMPGRADFFLLGSGVRGVRETLALAQILRRVEVGVAAMALTYNLAVIAASLGGLMSPLRAAIAMPVSSLAILSFVSLALAPARVDRLVRPNSRLSGAPRSMEDVPAWKSSPSPSSSVSGS